MTQFVYGGANTVLALGMGTMDGIATPFIGFMTRDPKMTHNVLQRGEEAAAKTISEIEASGGVVIWFDNPAAAERIHSNLAALFEHACNGAWYHKEEVTAKC